MTNLNVTTAADDAPHSAKTETSAADEAVVHVDVEAVEALRQSLAAEAVPVSDDAVADAETGRNTGDETDRDSSDAAGAGDTEVTNTATDSDENAVAESDGAEPEAGAGTPGLVQVARISRRTADDSAARAEKLRAIKESSRASELRDAEAAVAAPGVVTLTPAEERELRDIAEGEDDLQALRKEKLDEKREQAAMRQARRRVNDAVPSRTLVQRPTYGATRGKVYLHVRDTYAFLLGREANPETHKGYIAGMFAASKTMRTLVQGHIAGCPYATWYLVQIEEGMARFRALVQEKEAQARALVEAATPVRLEPFTSRRPAEVPLDFTASYGFHFADILVRFDNVLRILQSYLRQGFITQDEYRAIRQPLAKELRNLFRLPQQWRFVGKDAVMQQTNQLLAAEHDMGRLPQEILDGERLPQLV
jgi:hypothetical protein